MRIRRASPSDAEAMYSIAVATGNAGADASADHRHPRLIGDVYVGPYLASAHEHAFVLVDHADAPAGYVLGTPDTRMFESWS
jgi:hypothetical protein